MNYAISLSDDERLQLARAFHLIATKLSNAAPIVDATSGTDQARAILSPPTAASPSLAATRAPAQIPVRDRWARDRQGKEIAFPEGCEKREVQLWKTEQKPPRKDGGAPYLKVTWQGERGYVDANCFDSELFPWLIKSSGKKTVLYTVQNGKYINVVGVCA